MSGLYLTGIAVLWLCVTWLLWWLGWRKVLRREKGITTRKVLVGVVILAWLGASFWYGGGRKVYYDWQVERMCAVDGGVKVYERVELPRAVYEQFTKRNWVLPDKAHAKWADPYYYESETHYFRKSGPQVARTVVRIVRRADGAVLGEYIHYGRGGGDFPGPWHGSSFLCPDPSKSAGFETKIFIKGE